jgi:hypothetical protein
MTLTPPNPTKVFSILFNIILANNLQKKKKKKNHPVCYYNLKIILKKIFFLFISNQYIFLIILNHLT